MLISDCLIEKVTLYRSYFWLFRWDVIPFSIAYSLFFCKALSEDGRLRMLSLIGLPIALSLHLLLFLLSQWSTNLQCKLGNYIAKNVDQAEFVHVITAANAGNDRIVPIFRQTVNNKLAVIVAGITHEVPTEFFIFQQVTYGFDSDKNTFVQLEYPTAAPLMRY
jgi:hypothetical protein